MQESICFPHIISGRSSLTHWQWENFLNIFKKRKRVYWFSSTNDPVRYFVQLRTYPIVFSSILGIMTSELISMTPVSTFTLLGRVYCILVSCTSGHFTKNNKLSFVLTNSMAVPAFCHGTCKWTCSVITTTTWRVLPTKTYLNLWNKRFSCYWAMTHYWNADQWANLGNMCLIAQGFG